MKQRVIHLYEFPFLWMSSFLVWVGATKSKVAWFVLELYYGKGKIPADKIPFRNMSNYTINIIRFTSVLEDITKILHIKTTDTTVGTMMARIFSNQGLTHLESLLMERMVSSKTPYRSLFMHMLAHGDIRMEILAFVDQSELDDNSFDEWLTIKDREFNKSPFLPL